MKKDKELKVYNVWCVCVWGGGPGFDVEMHTSRDINTMSLMRVTCITVNYLYIHCKYLKF